MKTGIIQKAIIIDGQNVLALKRSETDIRRPLQWDLPGGWLDQGESFYEGIAREIQEETGLKMQGIPKLVYTKTEIRTWQNDKGQEEKGNCVFLFYLVNATGNVELSYEHVAYEWMLLDEAIDSFEYKLHKETVRYIKENNLN